MTARRLSLLSTVLAVLVICGSMLWMASIAEIPDRHDPQQWERANRMLVWPTGLLLLGFVLLIASWLIERAGKRRQ
ncbi:MAG TPA: hypothetical protein VMV94_08575 [Phycisphaerae bacterium]|nr:hypothetical protein [Phycisphaerae bacterium]